MADLQFEWDERKNVLNRRKHSVSFEEASTVFADEHALVIGDPDHSDEQDRFVLLGMSGRQRILVVCHCVRGDDDLIRIISARSATRSETEQYLQRWST